MTIDLMAYLPDYYSDVYEMQVLLKAQGGVLDKSENDIMRVLLNQFVTQTDVKGISIFEDQVGIKPSPGDDLETRQNKVLLRLLPPRPITLRYLQELFNSLKIPAKIMVDYGQRDAIVEAKSAEISNGQIENMKYPPNIYLPANMIYEIKIALNQAKTENNLFVGIGTWSKAQKTVQANVSQFKN